MMCLYFIPGTASSVPLKGETMDKRTPLYQTHVDLGGKMVSFGGFEMPVQYPAGVIKEHMAVREAVGIFDVSHMGELILEGPDALKEMNRVLTNDFTNMQVGRIRYSVICNEEGGCVDDLIAYKMNENVYMLVVNAANKDKDFEWIKSHLEGDVKFTDISDTVGQIAVQGPNSKPLMEKLLAMEVGNGPDAVLPEKYYWFSSHIKVAGVDCLISQTGYTGSFGYEIYTPADGVVTVWNALLEAGEEFGILPCGLGARDTLRLEAGMPLYGHEMNDEITPLEADLGFGVKMDKEFIGRAAMEAKGEPKVARVGIKVTGRGIAREHCDIYLPGGSEKIGETTSGTHCPYMGYAVAMGYVPKENAAVGTALEIDVRGRKVEAEIVPLPFYKR